MPRPSQNLDQALLKAGRELIQEEGLGKLSLRAVAKKAGVNLGMFHYHFKNKAEFAARCGNEAYDEFYRGFEEQVSVEGSTLDKLHRGLLSLGRFSRENRHFILSMLHDLRDKSPEAWAFVRRRFPPPHGRVILSLIRQGQKEGSLVKVPLPVAMSLLMSAIAFPNLIGGLAEKALGSKFLSLPKLAVQHYFLSDSALETRVELALRSMIKHPEATLGRRKK